MMTEMENNFQDTIRIPEFGEVDIIPTSNTKGCVDPRESLSPEQVQGDNSNWNSVVHNEGAERSPGASFGQAMSLKAAVPELSPQQTVDIVRGWEESEGARGATNPHVYVLQPGDQPRAAGELPRIEVHGVVLA